MLFMRGQQHREYAAKALAIASISYGCVLRTPYVVRPRHLTTNKYGVLRSTDTEYGALRTVAEFTPQTAHAQHCSINPCAKPDWAACHPCLQKLKRFQHTEYLRVVVHLHAPTKAKISTTSMQLSQLRRPLQAAALSICRICAPPVFSASALLAPRVLPSPTFLAGAAVEGRRYASVKKQGAYKIRSNKTVAKKLGAKRVGGMCRPSSNLEQGLT